MVGPPVPDLRCGPESAAAALAGLRAAPGSPDSPRPVLASELLPERALDGDALARAGTDPGAVRAAPPGWRGAARTVSTYLEQGSSLEATAKLLFVHPNTVRYRLRRITEVTGLVPSDGRAGFTLWVAIVLGHMAHKRT